MTDQIELLRHLRTMLGPDASFREGQREAIEAILDDGSRALVIERTGWGKSLVYWIATRVRRDAGQGPTLIVSPLLALMRNQIAMAARLGLKAVTINSANAAEWRDVEDRLARDAIDVLLISPERLASQDFVTRVLPSLQRSIGLLVVDEAHCISDWGHDFRPDYQRISRLLPQLGPTVAVLATTATANDRVVADVANQLGERVAVIRGPLARGSLRLDAIALADQAERLAWLAEQVPRLPGSGIIYCLTVRDAKTNDDLTRSILLQIILEEEAGGQPMFSEAALANLIRIYGHASQAFMGTYLEKNVQAFMEIQSKLTEQSKTLTPEMWSQFMNMQNPMMQGMMGNYVEQSKKTRRGPDAFTDLWKRVDSAVGAIVDTTTFAELARRWKEAQTRFVPNWEI